MAPAVRVVAEKAPLCVARRLLFEMTKRLSSCRGAASLNWRFFSYNSDI